MDNHKLPISKINQLFKNKELNNMIYKIKNTSNLKEAHFLRDKDELILYSPLKLKYSDGFNEINNKLRNLPSCLHEIVFSRSSVAFLWNEKAGIEELRKILSVINIF